ncbi:Receptor kinase-like protein xa21 [Heracleum sosnowskyi]|uniref:Receptor kinase-like protein xa21 n=1 Tax=Heracleum sosnowskyi TaxID=360622 RepID=A0AAD8IG11_9APIA|nr:Receptor kinase-like protein xa21 [Heracleum sosnowskyi]
MKGTIGYAAPELFTGRRPTDEVFRDGMNLHNFVNMAVGDQLMVVVDQSALYREEGITKEAGDIGSKWTHEQTEQLISIFRIGIACSKESPALRMDMRQFEV